MARVKVIITQQHGATGLRKVGTEIEADKILASKWVKMKIVKYKRKPKAKKSE